MAVRLNKNYLIASFLLALLTQSPALALDPQATGSLNPPPSSLITLGVGKPRTTDLRPWLWGAALRGNPQQSFPHTRPGSSEVRGKITGRVRVAGRIEKLEPLRVFKNKEFCGTRVPDETFLVGSDGGVKNAVIILRGPHIEGRVRLPKAIVLDNKKCLFVPHVQVAPVGSEVLLLNSDPILHDFHARLGSETLFNVGLPSWRQVKKRLTRRGIVAIECEVLHTWMSAYIVVTSSPYFAVADERGEFLIEGVPAGRYDLEVWHEKLGRLLSKVTVKENRISRVDPIFRCVSC